MNLFLILITLLLPLQEESHKIEVYVFNKRCIDIANLGGTESFQRQWRDIARKYKPEGVPILTSHDVVEFNKEKFTMTISEESWELIKKENIPSRGIPVMLVVDGEVSYGAWLWSSISASVCDGISFVFSAEPTEEKILQIEQFEGIPEEWRIPKSLQTE